MKKIYILTAVLALLSLSLNAQPMAKAPNRADRATQNYSYTFTSKQFSANDQTVDLGGLNWKLEGTYTGNGYWAYDTQSGKGQQFGSGSSPYSSLTLSTSGISGTITSISVNASTASNATATMDVTVGNTSFISNQSLTSTATTYTGSGSASGNVVISMSQPSTKKALYILSIEITYDDGSTTAILTAPVNNSTVDLGNHHGTASAIVNIKGSNLTKNLTVSVSGTGFSIDRDSRDTEVAVTAAEANSTNGQNINVYYNGTDATANGELRILSSEVNVTVNLRASYEDPSASTTYEKVTLASQLSANSQYILVCEDKNLALTSTSTANGNFLVGEAVNINSNTVLVGSSSSIAQFTLGGTVGAWTLALGSSYLNAGSGSTNLKINNTATTWTITNDNGNLNGFRVKHSDASRAVIYQKASNQFGNYSFSNVDGDAYSYAWLYKKVENVQPVHDLGITLSEPTAVMAGENATITATVTNNGNQTENGYTVTFSDGTNTFSTQTGGELAPGATKTFTATYTTSAAGTVTITANVACTDDTDATNDNATTTLTVNAAVHDLGIALSAPASVATGNTVTLTATVTNNGDYAETGYTVTFKANGTVIDTQTESNELAAGATKTFTATYTTTSADEGTNVNFTATVACTGDAVATNDNATASTSVVSSSITLPPPTNVVATPGDNQTATVTWNAPLIAPVIGTVTEDFEDTEVFPPFSTGDITATMHTGAFGNWSLYEPTGAKVFEVDAYDFENETNPHAWQVFDYTATTPAWTALQPPSGNQFMMSICTTNKDYWGDYIASNQWLISPELSGNAQTISYYDREITTSYGAETFELLYSTTDMTPASFTSLGSYSTNYTNWTLRTFNLPQDAKYFAIKHTGTDIFGLMVDDVTYEGLVPGVQPLSYNIYLDGQLVGNVAADAALTYDFSNLTNGEHTCAISAVYAEGESELVPATFNTMPKTATPEITWETVGDNVVITATGNGTVTLNIDGYTPATGDGLATITVPRSAVEQTITATATAQETGKLESDPATATITIPFLQTAAPVITTSTDANGNVVVTATGNGTVWLTVGETTVEGNGSASITLPKYQYDYSVTASAYAQESGKAVSETVTQEVTVPGLLSDGWLPMQGTFTGDQALTFIDESTGKRITFTDQFFASTLYNDHPAEYVYKLEETGYTHTSNPVTVPVFKTNSTMNGLYTEAEVLADNKYDENKLTANALNSKMTFDTQNANEMYRYQLYRGALNENPEINLAHTISQLQESNDQFTEQLSLDVFPMYDDQPAGTVMRNDRYFYFNNDSTIAGPFTQENPYKVDNADELAYVPVIWTMGFRTGRLDDLNNSYGSDIKRNVLNGANVITTVIKNEGGTNKFKVEGSNLDYYVYAPEITIDAKFPAYPQANDGDGYTYEPYMYRVWCTYTDAHAYSHLDNPDGHTRSLVDAGVIPAPFLIGEVKVADLPAGYPDPAHVVVGGSVPSGADWADYPWSFGAPKNTAGQFEFVIRYYYKKVVTDAAPSTSGLRGNRDGEDYYVFETKGSADNIVTGVNELWSGYGKVVISQTYVNAQGMQSDKPFDGLNIVVTRYSDGTTTTTKVIR